MNPFRFVVNWYRQVMPFRGLGPAFLFAYFIIEGVWLLAEARLGRLQPGQVLGDNNVLATSICVIAALVYGVLRVVYFHPLWQPEYRNWLAITPWTAKHALPQGPVLLQVPDLFIVGVLTCLSFRTNDVPWFVVPIVFLSAWMFMSMLTFAGVGPGWLAYVLFAACGLILRSAPSDPIIVGITFGVMAVLTYFGHWISIQNFHQWNLGWTEKVQWDAILRSDTEALLEATRNKLLGWPFDQLSPNIEQKKFLISPLAGSFTALLIGWQIDSVLTTIDQVAFRGFPAEATRRLALMSCLVLASIRLFSYVDGYLPPLSLFGRLRKMWLILPHYDQVLFVPIIVATMGWFGPTSLESMGLPHVTASAATIGVAMFLTFTMPPDKVNFQLTGSHRIVPNLAQRQAKEFLK